MTTTSGTAVVTLPSDTQILITREFAAPRHLVWRAYTEPDLIRRWWSGDRGEVTSVEVDLRVGGRWRQSVSRTGAVWAPLRMPSASRLSVAGCARPAGPAANAVNRRVLIASRIGATCPACAGPVHVGSMPHTQSCVPLANTPAPL